LDEHEVAFLETLAAHELAPGLGDDADVLVAHDHRRLGRRRGVELDVGAADPGHLHLHQRRILGDVGHREFADLGLACRRADGGQDFFAHTLSFSWNKIAPTPRAGSRLGRAVTSATSRCWSPNWKARCPDFRTCTRWSRSGLRNASISISRFSSRFRKSARKTFRRGGTRTHCAYHL